MRSLRLASLAAVVALAACSSSATEPAAAPAGRGPALDEAPVPPPASPLAPGAQGAGTASADSTGDKRGGGFMGSGN